MSGPEASSNIIQADVGTRHPPFDANAVRRDFAILREHVHGRPLIRLDNAATTQKPQAVIDRLAHFYRHENSNIHRAAHELAARATDAYEAAREKVRRLLNAPSADEIVFVRGATEAINLVAQSWGRQNIGRDEEIVITWLEHHANIVPWQQLCLETGARLRLIGTAPEKAPSFLSCSTASAARTSATRSIREGTAVRAGHHCAQPILRRFGVETTVRPSLALNNTFADIDALVAALHRIRSGSPLIG